MLARALSFVWPSLGLGVESFAWLARSETAAVAPKAKTATMMAVHASRLILLDELGPIPFPCFLIELSLINYWNLQTGLSTMVLRDGFFSVVTAGREDES